MLYLFRFFLGYVKFTAEGLFPERFINLLAALDVRVFGGVKKNGVFSCFIVAKDYKKLRTPAGKAGVKLKIKKKYGLPFIIHRYRKRLGFFCGFFLFCSILIFLSSFVWRIEISGNEIINDKEIIEALADSGLSEGVLKSKIDEADISQKVLLKIDDLSYVTVFLRGSVASVNVKEASIKEEKSNEPCNIVSDADGEIISIDVYKGQAKIKKGERVIKGQLLVSGIVDNKISNTFVHSSADIVARIDKKFSHTIPYTYDATLNKNLPYRRKNFHFFGLDLPLYIGRLPETSYRVFDFNERYSLFEKEIPIGAYTEIFYPLQKEKTELSESEAKGLAKALKMLFEIDESQDGKLTLKEEKYLEQKGSLTVEVSYQTTEKIGVCSSIGERE